jgi:hypothetical protein
MGRGVVVKDWQKEEIPAMRKFPAMVRLLRAWVVAPVRAWLEGGHALRWHRSRFGRSERLFAPVKRNPRRLLIGLLSVLALAGLAVALSLTPTVQTLVAQAMLARQPGLRSSLGSVSASFGEAEVDDLRLQYDGAVLVAPLLTAKMPVTPAVLHRDIRIQSLVAKGWTLDLSRREQLRNAAAADVAAGGAATEKLELVQALGAIMGLWALPAGISVEEIELDGHILLPGSADLPPVRLHIVAKGGGLAVGQECALDVTADAVLRGTTLPVDGAAFRGRMAIRFDAAGRMARVGLKGDMQAEGRATRLPSLVLDLAAEPGVDGVACTLVVARNARPLANVGAHFPTTDGPVCGTWKIDFVSEDLAPFLGRRAAPTIAAAGEGTFAATGGISRVQAAGRLHTVAGRLGALKPGLECLGEVTLDTGFDLTRAGDTVQVDRLSVAVAGASPVGTVRALQPFRVGIGTGVFEASDPHADWFECEIAGLPREWLADRLPGWTFGYGALSGSFVMRAAEGGVALRSTEPLEARDVSVVRGSRALGEKLGLTLTWEAEAGTAGWQVRCAPLVVGSAGRQLGTWEGTLAQPAGAGGAVTVAGKWSVDLETLATVPAVDGIRFEEGGNATGELTASFGDIVVFSGSANAVGRDPSRTFGATLQGRINPGGAGRISGPVRFSVGKDTVELGVDTMLSGQSGMPMDVELTGESVALEQVRALVAPAMAARAIFSDGAVGHDPAAPFWGGWLGRVRFSFAHLKVGDQPLDNASGVLEIERDCLRLRSGRGDLGPKRPALLEGSIVFDRNASAPYRLSATGSTDKLEAAKLFPPLETGGDPVISGRFALAATLTGSGSDWADLIAHTQQEYRLTSPAGIVRFLKTDLGGVNPEAESAVANALSGSVSGVGRLFSVDKRRSSGDRSLTKTAQAVLNFSYDVAELGYSQARVTAIRDADGTWRLTDIAMTTPDMVLTGSGRLGAAPGLALEEQPLEAEVQIGLRGPLAARLVETGLLSARKDGEGYTALCSPVRFGGTTKRLDGKGWHDLLFDAARTPPPEKKDR